MPNALGALEQWRQRRYLGLGADAAIPGDGQQYIAGFAYGIGQALVVIAVAALTEDHIKQNTRRLGGVQAFYQVGLSSTRPRPRAECFQARRIDGHQDDAWIYRQGREAAQAVIERIIER